MASPFPTRSRMSRSSLSTPIRGASNSNTGNTSSNGSSLLPRSPSTPYDIYHQRNRSPLAPAASTSRSSSAFISPSSSQNLVMGAYRRNAGFGSPGVGKSSRLSQGGGGGMMQRDEASPQPVSIAAKKGPRPPKYIRRKSFKQRLHELPSTIYDWILFSPLLDFSDPVIGYPAGLALHVFSLLALAIHPNGVLHLSLLRGKSASSSSRVKGLFPEQGGGVGGGGGLALRRRQAQEDAWKWFATMIIYLIFVAACSNAYSLFTSRRRYNLWMKPTSEMVSSENASFVELPHALDEDLPLSFQEHAIRAARRLGRGVLQALLWIVGQVFHQLRQLPYIGVVFRFLFPPTLSQRMGPRRSSSAPMANQMHAIDMWTAPDVQLRIFCLYSPLHAIFYVVHSRGSHSIAHFLFMFALMMMASAQVTLLVRFYTDLIKDKTVIAGEVLHEYDEKFVKPRAMTVSRDASTMTDEAEIHAAKRQSWINRRHSSDDEQYHSSAQVKTPSRRSKAGRKTAAV